MARPVIITCALTGGAPMSDKIRVPVSPAEIAQAAVGAAKAGAAIVHIHVRDPATGQPSMKVELYEETVARIRDGGVDVVINLTTGPGARFVPGDPDPAVGGAGTTLKSPATRVSHIERLKPEVCSLDVGSMNFGEHVFINTPAHLRDMAKAICAAGTKPELEVFELGHIRLARHLVDSGLIDPPPLFQICLGIPWGAPATPETMLAMRDGLPPGALWAGFGIGPAEFPMVAQAVMLGGHTRVGMEDNLYLARGVPATNAALVEKAVTIIELLGEQVATPAQARAILGLAARS